MTIGSVGIQPVGPILPVPLPTLLPTTLIPSDRCAKFVLAAMAALYVGCALGIPLLLQHGPGGTSPDALLAALGGVLVLIGWVVPPICLAVAARQLNKAAWPHATAAALFGPVGALISAASLWEMRSRPANGSATATEPTRSSKPSPSR